MFLPFPQQNLVIYMSKNGLKWKIKAKLENEKGLKKTYQSESCIVQKMFR